MRRLASLAALAASLAFLASCSPAAGSLELRPCTEVACTGTLNGAAYEIVLPDSWNGALVLYAHGYRPAQPVPPDFAPVSTKAEPAPGWSSGERAVGQRLLDDGYAIAGSAFASNGWAVRDGVVATQELYRFFAEQIGQPTRTYVWGDSLGGLVAAEVAENSDWVSGSLPMCGALAGVLPNFDLGLDVTYAVRELLVPDLQLAGYASYEEAAQALQAAGQRLLEIATSGTPEDRAALLLIAAIADAPKATRNFDGASPESRLSAAAEGVGAALVFGILGRYDLEQRLGGNPSDNTAVDYGARISATEQEAIESASPGALETMLASLAAGTRVAADPDARAAAKEHGSLTGALTRPTITLHTVDDPVVIVQNESWFADAVAAAGASGSLLQVFTAPPSAYPQDPGAPYGAGHCNFPLRARTASLELLDAWVATGERPSPEQIAAAFGPDQGLAPDYRPGPWPG